MHAKSYIEFGSDSDDIACFSLYCIVWGARVGCIIDRVPGIVRKTPSWPRSWANFSLLWLYSFWNAWANLHLLGQPNTFLAYAKNIEGRPIYVWRAVPPSGRFVALGMVATAEAELAMGEYVIWTDNDSNDSKVTM
jgi:hypothetical protein